MKGKLLLTSLLVVVLTTSVVFPLSAVAVQTEQDSNITDTTANASNTENTYVSFLSSNSDTRHNLVCENLNSDQPTQTKFGELINTVLYLIVTVGALVSVVLGAGFTMMSALKPTKDEYVERRNKAVIFGSGTIIVLYGVNAIMSELHGSLDFSCAIPFLGGV